MKLKITRKTAPWLAFAGCCAAFLLYVLLTHVIGDHTPPEISVPEEPLSVSVQADRQALLEGITARDDRDGDVTGQMVVESVSAIFDGGRAEMTAAAFDRAGNVAKARRTVVYTDYESPRFRLLEPMIFREGTSFDVFSAIGAEDAVDGRLDSRVKGTLSSGGSSVDRAGMYQVTFRVTNSLGDTVRLTLPVEVTAFTAAERRLALSTYLVYLKTGDAFDPMDYLTAGREYLERTESNVDMDRAGTYAVTYFDENGKDYGKTRLIVVVEE